MNRVLASDRPTLLRVLGRWDLTSIGVNQVIGGAIFAVPATLAATAGAWSPWLVIVVGMASLLIAMTFAEVASRFEGTGGPYLYARAAFGRFAAFEVGWMAWLTRVAAWASVVQIFIASIGFYWPAATSGLPAGGAGVRRRRSDHRDQLSWDPSEQPGRQPVHRWQAGAVANLVVVGLCTFPSRLTPSAPPSLAAFLPAGLTLVYAFGGYENIPVQGGEARDPRRGMPFALIVTLVIVTAVFTLVRSSPSEPYRPSRRCPPRWPIRRRRFSGPEARR